MFTCTQIRSLTQDRDMSESLVEGSWHVLVLVLLLPMVLLLVLVLLLPMLLWQ
jgi:hypothetical protein